MMRMTRLKSSLGCCVLLAGMCLAGLSAPADTPLGYFPDDATAALYLPSIDFVQNDLAPILKEAGVGDGLDGLIGTFPSRLGLSETATLPEIFKALGIDTAKPVTIFVQETPGVRNYGAVLAAADSAMAKEKIKGVFTEDGAENFSSGEAKGMYHAQGRIGYVMDADKVFLGNTQELITSMVKRGGSPYVSPYASEAGSEVALVTSIAKLQAAGVLPDGSSAGIPYSTIYDYFKEFIGEIVVAAGESNGSSYVRLAMANPAGSAIAPADSLKMHNLFPADAPVMFNLRNDAKLMQTLRPLLTSIPGLGQGAMYISLVSSMLGSEIGLALTGVTNNIPDGLIAATISNPASIKGLMGMAGVKDGPKEQINGADIYALENIREGLSVYIATLDTNLLVSTNLDTVKKALEKVSPEGIKEGGSPVDTAVLSTGNNGFLVLNGSKLDTSKLGGVSLPAGLDFSDINVLATLGSKGNWNELRLSTPNSMQDIAGVAAGIVN